MSISQYVTPARRGTYGIDAPYAPAGIVIVAIIVLGLAIASGHWQGFISVAFMFAMLGCYLHTTLLGKFSVWADLLDALSLRGDEQILDMGCGRGAVLLMAAQRLNAGRATGVDLWRSIDQSGNSMEATRRNAAAEGVADRIELLTGDMRAMPIQDEQFAVVVSSLAIHNIPADADRARAIAEAVRVLRPGGRVMIADIRATQRYARKFSELGMIQVSRRRLGWRFWWGGPWAATHLVTATKPNN